ncbi:MAG: DUF2207 domain-containing protein [Chloroflexi bacterium]|nr:DUF2207 domain-containing protein [Chloroflexota bacterium]
MTRKLSLIFMIILLFSLFVVNPVLAAKTYSADRFDVYIELQEDGSAVVTETVVFRFQGGDFTYVFRDISATETDGLTFLEASMDGVLMPPGTGAGQVEVRAGDSLKVMWHFPPSSDAHTFVLRYRADGVIRKGDADAFIWRAIPPEHEYSIASSTVTLIYPSDAKLLEQPGLSRSFQSRSTDDSIILTSSNIPENEEMIITARFAAGSLTAATPQWQIRQTQRNTATRTALPVGFVAGLVTLVLGGLGFLTYARSNSRELPAYSEVVTAIPPGNVPPAVVGKLTGQQGGFMGTIFDLAQRGVLEVQEERGFLGSTKHILVRKPSSVILRPHEQGLLDALFKPGESQVNMSEIGARLSMKNKSFEESLERELVERGWLDLERKQKRTRQVALAILGMIAMMTLGIISLFGFGSSLGGGSIATTLFAAILGAGVAGFLLSLILAIYAGTFSVLTPLGEEQSARWKGFAKYLEQVSKGREPAIRPDLFEIYLPVAAVFGLGAKWAKYFEQLGGVPLPVWFHAMAGSQGDFSAMVAVMSSSDSTAASAAAGGAAGASGGGSSGAG